MRRSKTGYRWYEINPRPGKVLRVNFEADAWDLERHKETDLLAGKRIEDWKGEGWFAASTPDLEGPLEDVLRTSNLLPVFSERLKTCLKANSVTGLQYLPVRVFDSRRQWLANYYLVNLLNHLPALDEEKSIIRRTSIKNRDGTVLEWISVIENLTLRQSILKGFDIIQLAEFRGTFFVSQRFRDLFEQTGLSGWGFRPVHISDK